MQKSTKADASHIRKQRLHVRKKQRAPHKELELAKHGLKR